MACVCRDPMPAVTGQLSTSTTSRSPSRWWTWSRPSACAQIPRSSRPAGSTRVISGRPARALLNDFIAEHEGHAPAAYPQVHHLTSGLRAAAGEVGNPQGLALWAGVGYRKASDEPAAKILRDIWAQTRTLHAPDSPVSGR